MFFHNPVCPSCKKTKNQEQTLIVTSLIRELYGHQAGWFDFFFKGDKELAYKRFTKQKSWACDSCLDNDKALVANPLKQTFCDHFPYLAYLNVIKVCRTCQHTFTFSKEEQQYWYEELGFWVQSEAINCQRCRQEKRKRKNEIKSAQKMLDQILPNLDTQNEIELREVIRLYDITCSTKKVVKYNKVLKALLVRNS